MSKKQIKQEILRLNHELLCRAIDESRFKESARKLLRNFDWQERIQFENLAVLPV